MTDAKQELQALWIAVFGEPPVIDAGPELLAHLIVRCSAPPPVYGDTLPGVRTATPDGCDAA
ncbi:MAG TPA: hypothetical protein VMT68_04360 [Caulobacteraceae bacterium]|nr:hypothetical protein [Caulobacteraceae bacterium]